MGGVGPVKSFGRDSSLRKKRLGERQLGESVQELLDQLGKVDKRMKVVICENNALKDHCANIRNELENKQSLRLGQATATASNLDGITAVLEDRVAGVEDKLMDANAHLREGVCNLQYELELMQKQGNDVASGSSSSREEIIRVQDGEALDALKRALKLI